MELYCFCAFMSFGMKALLIGSNASTAVFACKDKISFGGETQMPNANVLSQKQAVVAELVEKMKNASAGVFVDYKGITVEADTKLRASLREAGVEYSVVKNTLVRFAANQVGFEALDPILNGTTALAFSMTDSIAPARLIGAFAKKNEKFFKIKAGFIDGQVVDVATVNSISELPSKDVLLSIVLGTFNAPIAALARVLNAVCEQKGGAPAAEEAAPEAAPEA